NVVHHNELGLHGDLRWVRARIHFAWRSAVRATQNGDAAVVHAETKSMCDTSTSDRGLSHVVRYRRRVTPSRDGAADLPVHTTFPRVTARDPSQFQASRTSRPYSIGIVRSSPSA